MKNGGYVLVRIEKGRQKTFHVQ